MSLLTPEILGSSPANGNFYSLSAVLNRQKRDRSGLDNLQRALSQFLCEWLLNEQFPASLSLF